MSFDIKVFFVCALIVLVLSGCGGGGGTETPTTTVTEQEVKQETVAVSIPSISPEQVVTDSTTQLKVVQNQIIIKLKDGQIPAAIQNIVQKYGISLSDSMAEINLYLVDNGNNAPDTLIEQLENEPEIELVGKNFVISFKAGYPQTLPGEYSETTYGHLALSSISAPMIWGIASIHASRSDNLAIVDSGMDTNNADLKDAWTTFIYPEKVVTGDENGHGTAVAGVVAAKHNTSLPPIGLQKNPGLTIVKVEVNGFWAMWQVARGIDEAAKLSKVKVINLSWGACYNFIATGVCNITVASAIKNAVKKGKLVVIAAGQPSPSSCLGESDPKDVADTCPANLSMDTDVGHSVITVGGVNNDGLKIPSSNFGAGVSLWAPWSAMTTYNNSSGYAELDGTSISAPYVSAVASLMFTANSALTSADVKKILIETADTMEIDSTVSGMEKRLNAWKAVMKAANMAGFVINSNPQGADVYVDGTVVRDTNNNAVRTPAKITVSLPVSKITLKLAGYQDYDFPSSSLNESAGGIKDLETVNLRVVAPPPGEKTLTSISVSCLSSTLTIKEQTTCSASGTYSDGSTSNITSSASWTSLNSSIASVSGNTVTAISEGTTTVRAALLGISGSFTITVKKNNPPQVNVTASSTKIGVNKTSNVACNATDSDGDSLTYTWDKDGGTLSSTENPTVIWTAPSTPGAYSVCCTASDGKGGEAWGCAEIEVTDRGGVTVTW